MKLLFTLVLILTAFGTSKSQNYTLPSALVDSLIYEAKRGRACGEALNAAKIELGKAEAEILANGRAIDLLNDNNAQAVFMWDQYKFLYTEEAKKGEAEISRLKTQRKGLIKWVVAEGIGVVALTVLLIIIII